MDLKDRVFNKKKKDHIALENIVMEVNSNRKNLFLAAEKGDGKHEENLTIMMNRGKKTKLKMDGISMH